MIRSITVKDFMTASLIKLSPKMSALDAVHQLVTHRISGAPVVDDQGELVGMLTEKDCMKLALSTGYHGSSAGRVNQFMSTEVETVDADMSILDLAQQFLTKPYRRYPVMDGQRMVGIISRRDVLRALLER